MRGMFTFSANLSTLFTDMPLAQRFAAAHACGFTAVECQFPYELPVGDIAAALRDTGQQLVLHNLPAGDWAAGERGIACHPGRELEFQQGVQRALDYAVPLGVQQINCLAGICPVDVPPVQAWATLRANLRYAAQVLAQHRLRLLIEPINAFDIPGFLVSTPSQALALMDELALDNVYLQYDVYHAQRMEGELAMSLQRALPRIGHIQIADNPGRAEPGSGEIAYRFVFDWLDRIGYERHVGCEYFPADKGPGGTQKGMVWLAQHGRLPSGQKV
jgi:hydroxypyruvate isomerase